MACACIATAQPVTVLSEEAASKVDSLRSLLELPTSDSIKAQACIAIAGHFVNNNMDSVMHYRARAVELCRLVNDLDCVMYQSRLLAYSHINAGQFEQARTLLEMGERHFTEELDEVNLSNVYIASGFMYRRMGQIERALDYYTKALEIKQRVGDERNVSNIYNRIGIALAGQEKYEQAVAYFEKIIERCERDSLCFFYTAALYNAGDAYREMGHLEQAKKYLSKSIERRAGSRNFNSLGYLHFGLGQIALAEGDTTEGRSQLEQALANFLRVQPGGEVGNVRIMLGDVSRAEGKINEAIEHYQAAVVTAETIQGKTNQGRVFKRLAECYALQGRHAEAYAALLEHERALAARGVDVQLQLASQEKKLDSVRSAQQIALLNANNAFQVEQVQRQRTFRNVLLAFSVLLLGLLFIVFKQLKHRRSTQAKLEEQNKIIQDSLQDKEDLLKEIHHRVKNNLQIVASMLHLQGRHVKDPQVLEALRDSRNRVNSMALIHQNLYREEHLKGINMREYINSLTQSLSTSYQVDTRQIELSTDVQPIMLDVDSAIPIGLITNELVTNALKYAFEGRPDGKIHVRLSQENGVLNLRVTDTGVGLPDDFDPGTRTSYGYQLINSLARKLKADISFSEAPGCGVHLQVHKFESMPV